MKHIKLINELFHSDNIYDVILEKVVDYKSGKSYRMYFITKDDVKYRILLNINNNGIGKLDFDTIGLKNSNYDSVYDKINTKDSIKVFNTLRWILLDQHKEINKIMISSGKDRLVFYKKLLNFFNIETTEDEYGNLIGIVK